MTDVTSAHKEQSFEMIAFLSSGPQLSVALMRTVNEVMRRRLRPQVVQSPGPVLAVGVVPELIPFKVEPCQPAVAVEPRGAVGQITPAHWPMRHAKWRPRPLL